MSSASVPHPVGPRANCQLDVVISGLPVSKAQRCRSSRDLYYPKYLIVSIEAKTTCNIITIIYIIILV